MTPTQSYYHGMEPKLLQFHKTLGAMKMIISDLSAQFPDGCGQKAREMIDALLNECPNQNNQ